MFTMFYYTTANTSQRVSSNVYYRLCSICPRFALMQAVRRRCHRSMALSTMCCSRSIQMAISSWARLLFKHLISLKSLWIMRLTKVCGILSSLDICLVDRCVLGLYSWLWTSSSTAAMLSAVRTDCGKSLSAVRSMVPVVRSFWRKSSSVRLFQFFWGNSFISRLEENPLHSYRF